jgi:imidazolonepropionase-like amidohydrolase
MSPPAFTLLKASRLIDGTGARPIDDGAVLIEGSKVVAAGRASDVAAPEGASVQVWDYPHKTLMPGMVDCHTHNNGFGDGRPGDELVTLPDEVLTLQSARNARTSLFSGVTTVRENGPKNSTMFRLGEAIDEGIAIGPRIINCGRPVAIIGGHMGYFGSEATGPTEARAMTRQLIKEGADYIKITATGGSTGTSLPLRPSFNVDELRAVTDEAHKFGKLTAAHCSSTDGIVRSLDAGVDMIIHCIFKNADGAEDFLPEVAERIARQEAYVNPTLHVARSAVWSLQHLKNERKLSSQDQQALDDAQRNFETRLDHGRRLLEMGLKLITGSDSSWGDYQLGNTVYETECLAMAGMSSMQAVQSITGEAARALGVDHTVGTLESGKEADVIVVDGDPTANINDLWNVAEVFLAGRPVDRGSAGSREATRQMPPS